MLSFHFDVYLKVFTSIFFGRQCPILYVFVVHAGSLPCRKPYIVSLFCHKFYIVPHSFFFVSVHCKNMLTIYKYNSVINSTSKNVTLTNRTPSCVNYRENVCGWPCSLHSEQIQKAIQSNYNYGCYTLHPEIMTNKYTSINVTRQIQNCTQIWLRILIAR